MKTVIRDRDTKIKDLVTKVNQTPATTTKDFNTMNIELNAYKSQLEEARREIQDLKRHKRTPLKQINPNRNVLAMLQHKETNVTTTPSKPPIIKKESKENNNQIFVIPSSSQSNETNESYTQTEEQQGGFDETNEFPSEPYMETYDARNAQPIIQESFDLRAGNVMISSSSQADYSEEEYKVKGEDQDESEIDSSPSKLKQESSDSQVSFVKDSQGFDEDDEIKYNFPTPQTTSKFRTPKIPATKPLLKHNHQLQTPNDNETPMKKRPKIKRSESSELITSTTIDLTVHPLLNRKWVLEDFKVNPELNNGIPHAYEVVIRGKARECLHGKTCDRCDKFYSMAGHIPDFEGPKWSDEASAQPKFDIVTRSSRHKELWDRPETPPGVGDFGFPTKSQEMRNRERSDKMLLRIAYERLYSALHDKKFIFKNEDFNKAVKDGYYKVDEQVFVKYLKKSK